MNQPIRLSQHARLQLAFRGTSEEEISDAIRNSPWRDAELGRKECAKDFPYDQAWNGKHYKTKRVRPIFAEESGGIVVVTVYVYYCS